MFTWLRTLVEWLSGYKQWHNKCDGCQLGGFKDGVLTPVSGDWWLCNSCLKERLKP